MRKNPHRDNMVDKIKLQNNYVQFASMRSSKYYSEVDDLQYQRSPTMTDDRSELFESF